MAIDNGNKISGSIGPIIYYSRNGKKCMRKKPGHVSNPQTPAQEYHRNKLKLSSRFIRSLKGFIELGYQQTSLDTPVNEARQHLMRDAFVKTPEGPVPDYSKIRIARGDLAEPQECLMQVEENQAHITWYTDRHFWPDNVKVNVAMFIDEESDGISHMLNNVAYQNTGSCTVQIPLHNKPVNIWLFFYYPDLCADESRKKVSNSVFLGVID